MDGSGTGREGISLRYCISVDVLWDGRTSIGSRSVARTRRLGEENEATVAVESLRGFGYRDSVSLPGRYG